MDNFKLDARKWKFLSDSENYIPKNGESGLVIEPLERQFKTTKEILSRFQKGLGVLLADDVGLGKTTVGALVAWAVACQGKRVRIYAPNKTLQRRWAEELERHVPMLESLGAKKTSIRQRAVERLMPSQIQVATHSKLLKSHGAGEQKTECDLMIIDEAHHAKGEHSKFKVALSKLGNSAKRKLILTATPFSIDTEELVRMLELFVEESNFKAVRRYALDLKRLYSLGEGHDASAESKRLVGAAKAAIEELQPYLIRHGIDDLSANERKHFGAIASSSWEIKTPDASSDDIQLLLRMDRILQLSSEKKGARRNDPRFHTGWEHVGTELERAEESLAIASVDHVAKRHIEEAKKALHARLEPHPKIRAVEEAILAVIKEGEKVLVFCHHHATASELLGSLERSSSMKTKVVLLGLPPEKVWRDAWGSVLPNSDSLVTPIIDWLCSLGVRKQVAGWIGSPAGTAKALAKQFAEVRSRNSPNAVTILEAAKGLVKVLLDEQSTSTRKLMSRINKGDTTVGGKQVGVSHFPGLLDENLRVMGYWKRGKNDVSKAPETLYSGKADIVIALFNSPFGPDVLVTTDSLSEGVDLHRYCRHLIHYELDPSPVRTLQRNGRIRRVGSWAAVTKKPIFYAYPTFGGTRDEKAVGIMRQRISAFGLLLGGVPSLDDEDSESHEVFVEKVLGSAEKELKLLGKKLCVKK